MKKTICILLCAVILIATSIFAVKVYRENKVEKIESTVYPLPDDIDSYTVKPILNAYTFNPGDTEKMVGCYDYLFVAQVIKCNGTYYKDVEYTESGELVGNPFTRYEIKVIDNIKGELIQDEAIPISMHGGVNLNGKTVSLAEGSAFPKIGEYYLILAYANKDGELLIGVPDCCKHLEASSQKGTEAFSGNSIVKQYTDAFKNQDTSVKAGEGHKSKYDVTNQGT